ncbi:hypothetical protein HN51_056338, partial [Arachis hypogaea]
MARLLGDLVAYRATGTCHMELLANKKDWKATHLFSEKAQPDASPNPSVPAIPNTVNVSEESATPNTVPAPSIPLDNNAQPKSPTYTEPPSTSDDPQDEFLTQYVPLPQNQPSSQAMPEPHPTPPTQHPFYQSICHRNL